MNETTEPAQEQQAALYIFGATGDLAKRKLYPAIFSMYCEGKLKEKFAVIGLARRPKTREQFRQDVFDSIREFSRYKVEQQTDLKWVAFIEHFEYMSLDIHNVEQFQTLHQLGNQLDKRFAIGGNRLFYLALSPELFGNVTTNLKIGGLLQSNGCQRLVIEKPFGHDLASAQKLNQEIQAVFREEDIYRIDHYLGKEMVQNIEVIRFANAFFEPLWNHKYIANIQITLSETVGVEDRGHYYEQAGALRDMGQNHMLQMLAMMAMEAPSRLLPEDIRDEKVKVLRSLRMYDSSTEVIEHIVRGQYQEGAVRGQASKAYRDEDLVDEYSVTETYFAAKLFVDNFRWAGVPFYIRTGKRLPQKTTEVVVEFKNTPENIYFSKKTKLEPNLLVFRVNPTEGISIRINAKQAGTGGWGIEPVAMDFTQSEEIGMNTPEAYERLLYDAVRADHTYFTRWDEVLLAWTFVDRIAHVWQQDSTDLKHYAAGEWGPSAADMLLAKDGFKWWSVG